MAAHVKSGQEKQEKAKQSRRVSEQNSEPFSQKSIAWDISSYLVGETPFNPPIQRHATRLSKASSEQQTIIARQLQQTYGNTYVQRLIKSLTAQEKPTVNPTYDQYEREADKMSDATSKNPGFQIQRQNNKENNEEDDAGIKRHITPEEKEKVHTKLQRQITLEDDGKENKVEMKAKNSIGSEIIQNKKSQGRRSKRSKQNKKESSPPPSIFTSDELSWIMGVDDDKEKPLAPKFSLELGANYKADLEGVALDKNLEDNVLKMAEYALRNSLVTSNIVFGSGVRSRKDAHRMSTNYMITMDKLPLKNLQALPDGKDKDGNIWYMKEWETTDKGEKVPDSQIKQKAIENARKVLGWSQTAPANEGYEDAKDRAPNIVKNTSVHCTGKAIDATIHWDPTKGKKSQKKVADPTKVDNLKKKAREISNKKQRDKVLGFIKQFEERGAYSATPEETTKMFGLERPLLHAKGGPEDWHYQMPGSKKK